MKTPHPSNTINESVIGEQFHDLKALAWAADRQVRSGKVFGEQRWSTTRFVLCKCVCGTTLEVRMHNLLSGNSKSCGCLKVHVFQPGQRFGRLVVTGRHGKSKLKNDKKGYEWLWACRCDCGNTYVAKAHQLFKEKVLSCGCLREFRCGSFLPEGVAAANHLFWKYKKWAKTKKRSFTISKERAFELFVGNCHYCGVAPYRKHAYSNDGNGTFTFNGIDRVDNSKGYDEGNLVSCCTPCNHAKLNRPVDDFLEWVRRVAQHQGMINV